MAKLKETTVAGDLAASGKISATKAQIDTSAYGDAKVTRKESNNAASIAFENKNGTLGGVGMTGTPDTGIVRITADGSKMYPVLDTENFTSIVKPSIIGAEPANPNIQGHLTSEHAPADAQKNSDITKEEIEAKLVGEVETHTHNYATKDVATIATDGLMSSADKDKLDGVEVGANAYVHPNNYDIRHVSDDEKSVWNGTKAELDALKEQVSQNKPIIITDDTPVGTIAFIDSVVSIQDGWLKCDGSAVSVIEYPELFGVIGYTHGGAEDNFNLPNLKVENLVIDGINDAQTTIDSKVVKRQIGMIKAKKLGQDMLTVAQQWNSFKDNGGEVGGNIIINKADNSSKMALTGKGLSCIAPDETTIGLQFSTEGDSSGRVSKEAGGILNLGESLNPFNDTFTERISLGYPGLGFFRRIAVGPENQFSIQRVDKEGMWLGNLMDEGSDYIRFDKTLVFGVCFDDANTDIGYNALSNGFVEQWGTLYAEKTYEPQYFYFPLEYNYRGINIVGTVSALDKNGNVKPQEYLIQLMDNKKFRIRLGTISPETETIRVRYRALGRMYVGQ